jgi:hypothetical protein
LYEYIKHRDNESKRIVDWDTLMARILIYEGPTEALKTVLLHDKKSYDDNARGRIRKICNTIIAGLEMRYIDRIFNAKKVSEDQNEYYAFFEPRIKEYQALFHDDHAIKMECKALAQSYIDTIVKSLTSMDVDKVDLSTNKFAENSIQDTIEILKIYIGEVQSDGAERAFLQTIKAFLAFYEGIRKCCSARMRYEFEKSSKILSPDVIEEFKKDIERDFFAGVLQKNIELSERLQGEKAVELSLKELQRLANISAEESRFFNAVLARAPINAAKLEKIFILDENKDRIVFLSEDSMSIYFEQARDKGRLVEQLLKILEFLTGEYDPDEKFRKIIVKEDYAAYKEHAKKVIYPQIVTFAKHREDGDSNDCLIMDHSGAFAGWHDGEVQILTEFKYKMNQAYYALPNLNRIETEWWVDPLLVSCYKFDEEIRKATSGVNS